MEKRYQVFISSTFEDLIDERQAVLKAILGLGHIPAGMELFSASDDDAWKLICDVIDVSDYYTLIIGGRYGSLDEEGISYTEKEYEYAVQTKKPVIALLHRNPNNLPRDKTETDDSSWKKLESFRKKVEANHTCVYWENPDELKAQVILSLTSESRRRPAKGWVRADSLASNEAAQKIIKLREIIDSQKEEIERLSLSAPVGSEDLAQGSDEINIEIRVNYTKDYSNYHDEDRGLKKSYRLTVTWDDLFNAFAPEFIEPNRDIKIKSTIARHFRELYENQLYEGMDGYSITAQSISETLFQTIRVQFFALGLIDCFSQTKIEKDKEKDYRMCQLTPYGKKHLINVKAIYKSQP